MIDKGLPTFRAFVPKHAVGASLVYFDLFNAAGTGFDVLVQSVIPIVSGAVAVTGVVGVDLLLTRTTAVGTGGTAATAEGTALDALTISSMSKGPGTIPAGLTARLTPTGGATAGAVLSWGCVFTEETNDAPYHAHLIDLVRRRMPDVPAVEVVQDSGIRVVQGSVASVGNIGFDVIFQLRAR